MLNLYPLNAAQILAKYPLPDDLELYDLGAGLIIGAKTRPIDASTQWLAGLVTKPKNAEDRELRWLLFRLSDSEETVWNDVRRAVEAFSKEAVPITDEPPTV